MSTGEELTWEILETKLNSLRRGKLREKIKHLEWLKNHAEHPAQKLRILHFLVYAQVSFWMSIDDMDVLSLMPIEVWRSSIRHMLAMLQILALNPQITIRNDVVNDEWMENYKKGPEFKGNIQVIGDLIDLVVRLNYHFFTGLGYTDPNSEEHKKWLLEEPNHYVLCQSVLEHLLRAGQSHLSAEVARIVHTLISYKTPEMYRALCEKCEENIQKDDVLVTLKVMMPQRPFLREDYDAWMTELRGLVFSFGDKVLWDIMNLRDIYHWAIVDNFWKAMDGMVCFLREVGTVDYIFQFDFNRALAQLGLCAFRAGRIAEAHACLSWLYGGGRVDILLGQAHTHLPIRDIYQKPGVSGYIQTPHHLHVDLEVLKNVYRICAMLLEFPNMDEGKRRESLCDLHEDVLAAIQTPSEGKLSAGIQALRDGNFSDTITLIEGLDLWGVFKEGDKLLELIKMKIREVAFVKHQMLLDTGPHSVEAEEFELTRNRRNELICQCFFSDGVPVAVSLFQELTQSLSFFAFEHEKIFEDSIYKFQMKASGRSIGDLAQAASLLVWDESLSISSPVLRLFLFSDTLKV